MKSWVELKVEDEGVNDRGVLVVDEYGDIYVTDDKYGYVCVWSDDQDYIGTRECELEGVRKFHGRIILEQ